MAPKELSNVSLGEDSTLRSAFLCFAIHNSLLSRSQLWITYMSGMYLTNSVKLKVAQLVRYRVFLHDLNSLKIYNATIIVSSNY